MLLYLVFFSMTVIGVEENAEIEENIMMFIFFKVFKLFYLHIFKVCVPVTKIIL